jgi:hypothetical protein
LHSYWSIQIVFHRIFSKILGFSLLSLEFLINN